MFEAFARLQRLRRQEKHLREKAAEMVRRGCEDLDELEEAEQRDAVARSEALSEVQLLEDHGVIDWSAMDLGAFSASFDPGVVGGSSSGGAAHG